MPGKQRFEALDGWRGMCALMVALFHLPAYGHFYEMPLVRHSFLFVDFFFVLSGFVITHAYLDRLGTLTEFRSFIVRRLGRLWPLHAATLAFLVGIELARFTFHSFSGDPRQPLGVMAPARTVISNIFLAQALPNPIVFSWNLPAWSISAEFYTYIAFGLAVLYSRRSPPLLIALFIFFGAAISMPFSGGMFHSNYGSALFRCMFGFAAGHLVYRIHASGFGAAFARLWYVEILALALIVSFVSFSQMMTATAFVFGFVVWVFAHRAGPVSRIMETRPLISLGAWSYSIYMLQYPVLRLMELITNGEIRYFHTPPTALVMFPGNANPVLMYVAGGHWVMDALALVYLGAIVALSALSYRFIETPGRRFFNSLGWARSGGLVPAPIPQAL